MERVGWGAAGAAASFVVVNKDSDGCRTAEYTLGLGLLPMGASAV